MKTYGILLVGLAALCSDTSARTLRNETDYPARVTISYDERSGDDEDVVCATYTGQLMSRKNVHLAPCRVAQIEAFLALPAGELRVVSSEQFPESDDLTLVITKKNGEEAYQIVEQSGASPLPETTPSTVPEQTSPEDAALHQIPSQVPGSEQNASASERDLESPEEALS